jgi:hypothetical protein
MSIGISWDEVRERVNSLGAERGEWAGVPVPVRDAELVVEPRYPFAKLNGATLDPSPREELQDALMDAIDRRDFSALDLIQRALEQQLAQLEQQRDELAGRLAKAVAREHVNRFYCHRKRCVVHVFREKNGRPKIFVDQIVPTRNLDFAIATMGSSTQAHSIEAEAKAIESLRSLVTESAYRCYFLCGMFLETSKRSGVTYLFRKLRPTVAIKNQGGERMKLLTTLCLHPIGYYTGGFAGAMVPTDDVIAHLMLMRADERRYWAKANHHGPFEVEAGL